MQARERAITVISLHAVIVVMAIGIAVAPTLISSNVAQASSSTKTVQGSGIGGAMTCPTSTIPNPNGFTIGFFASKTMGGKIAGNWTIDERLGGVFGPQKTGDISGGLANNNKYNLKGIENFDTICGSLIPTTMSISGQCGTGVQINFQAADGEKATFTGNVACT